MGGRRNEAAGGRKLLMERGLFPNSRRYGMAVRMRATIELPEPVFQILQAHTEQRSLSIQAVILEAIKRESHTDERPPK